jgi:hypothetical protein
MANLFRLVRAPKVFGVNVSWLKLLSPYPPSHGFGATGHPGLSHDELAALPISVNQRRSAVQWRVARRHKQWVERTNIGLTPVSGWVNFLP